MRKVSDEVFYANIGIVKAQDDTISKLMAQANANERKRSRLCAHHDQTDALHEMLIVHTQHTYVRPHKHPRKSESFHVITGRLTVLIFDDWGAVVETIPMGPYGSGAAFYYRLSEPRFHTLLISTEIAAFHEVTNGPFDRSETIFAPWSPAEDDSTGQSAFLTRLTTLCDPQK